MRLRYGSWQVIAVLALSAVLFVLPGSMSDGEEGGSATVSASASLRAQSDEAVQLEAWEKLLNDATGLARSGQNKEALRIAEEALSEAKTAHGEVHRSVALVMHRLASIHQNLGRSDTESLYLQTIALWDALPQPDPVDKAKTMSNLGDLYTSQLRYRDAEKYLLEALEIKRENLAGDNPSIAYTLGALGSLYAALGDYSKAGDYKEAALDIRRHCDPPDPVGLFNSLIGMAGEYSNLWMQDRAVARAEEALQVAESLHVPGMQAEALAALSWLNLGVHPTKSISSASTGLALLDGLDEPDPLLRAELLRDLGIAYRKTGRPDKALECHLRGDSLYQAVQDEGGSGLDRMLLNLNEVAEDYRVLGRYDSAGAAYARALEGFEGIYGKTHPYVGEVLGGMASLCLDTGNGARGLEVAKRMYQVWDRDMTEALHVLSGQDALSKEARRSRSADMYFTFLLRTEGLHGDEMHDAARIALGVKGQVSDAEIYRQRAMAELRNPEATALVTSLKDAKLELSDCFVTSRESGAPTLYDSRLDSLSGAIRDMESQLALRSKHLTREMSTTEVLCEDVAAALPEGGVLVEYLNVNIYENSPDSTVAVPHYLAMALDGAGDVDIRDLGPSEEIEDLVKGYRGHMLRVAGQDHAPLAEDGKEYARLASALYRTVVAPVEAMIAGRGTVFVSPDGALNLVSFAGLVTPDSHYFIEDHDLRYLSAGRDLLRSSYESEPGHGLLAMGDPDFDAGVGDRLAGREQVEPGQRGADGARTRAVRPDCASALRRSVKPLVHSRGELDRIVGEWASLGESPVDRLVGAGASEDNFKAMAPGHRVIHLSTHGYYDDGSCASEGEEGGGPWLRNPLLLSWLYFAGANREGSEAEEGGCEDGILTAYEVSAMDLDGTDLVVLSACETGLGGVVRGEGVYGLRRAFLVAGAKSVVCALWPVSDETTAEMMGGLYSVSGMSVQERIREVQFEEIRSLRKAGRSDHPYNWAGFIALGDWQ